ncbi:MAG: metallophosphoesterase [Candidatus Thermoplasmatota archaeon]
MLQIQPIPNEPALLIEKNEILVIADLHIGIEHEFYRQGVHISSHTKKITQQIMQLLKKYKPKNVLLLGDIKHTIPTSTHHEQKEISTLLVLMQQYSTVHLVPGNHDGGIKALLPPGIILHPSDGCILQNIGFIHGHRWPKQELLAQECIIIGHTHPSIQFTDRQGYKTYEPCWLRGKTINMPSVKRYAHLRTNPMIIVLPAYNRLCGSIAVNREPLAGPFAQLLNRVQTDVYLLDGSLLGKLKDIK